MTLWAATAERINRRFAGDDISMRPLSVAHAQLQYDGGDVYPVGQDKTLLDHGVFWLRHFLAQDGYTIDPPNPGGSRTVPRQDRGATAWFNENSSFANNCFM